MPKLLRVLMVEPHKAPFEMTVADQLDDLQETVGGLIEVIGNGDGTLIVCNEESKSVKVPQEGQMKGNLSEAEGFFGGCGSVDTGC